MKHEGRPKDKITNLKFASPINVLGHKCKPKHRRPIPLQSFNP